METDEYKEAIETIIKWLWWDYDNNCWREDPGWVGLDELCAINDLFIDKKFYPEELINLWKLGRKRRNK